MLGYLQKQAPNYLVFCTCYIWLNKLAASIIIILLLGRYLSFYYAVFLLYFAIYCLVSHAIPRIQLVCIVEQ